MERHEALTKAQGRSMTRGDVQLVICRTDHPHFTGEWYYVIGYAEKHAWTPGEHVVDAFQDGESVEVAV